MAIDNDHFLHCPYDHYPGRMKRALTGILPSIEVDRDLAKPLYRQLYEGYREAIVSALRAGQRLPSTRRLAHELRISRIPVLNAFEQLLAEGYLESRVGAGTFVASSLPDERLAAGSRSTAQGATARPGQRVIARGAAERPRPDMEPWLRGWGAFRVSQPAVDHFPFQVWSRLVSRHCRHSPRSLLHYGDPMGHKPFRETLAAYLRTARGIRCEAEQIMVHGRSLFSVAEGSGQDFGGCYEVNQQNFNFLYPGVDDDYANYRCHGPNP